MSALPFIKVYPGDELKMCGHLPLDVYGGYLKLRYKMWDAPERGKIKFDIPMIRRVTGADNDKHAETIVNTLLSEGLLKKEGGELHHVEMIAADQLSKTRSETGSKGGAKTAAKNKKQKEFANDFAKANIKQNPEYEYEYELVNENEKGKGVIGENPDEKPTIQQLHQQGKIRPETMLDVDDCLWMYLYSDLDDCVKARQQLAINRKEFGKWGNDGLSPVFEGPNIPLIGGWGQIFNVKERSAMRGTRPLHQYSAHFFNWVIKQDLTKTPTKYFDNATTGSTANQPGSTANNYGNARRNGATVTDLQNRKRGGSSDDDERTGFTPATVVG